MKIKKYKIVPIIERAYCSNCGMEMTKDNIVLLTSPPQFKYECPKCGKKETSTHDYPKIKYEEIGEEIK